MPRRNSRARSPRGAPEPYQRPDGTWSVSLDLGYKPDGTRNRRSLYGKTKAAVQDKLTQARKDAANGTLAPTTHETVATYLTTWIEHEKVPPAIRPTSWIRYRSDIYRHLLPRLGSIPLRKLTPADVRGLLAALGKPTKDRPALAPRSIRSVRDVLRAALNDALAAERVTRNVAALVKVPPAPKHEGIALEAVQVRQLLTLAAGTRFEAFVALTAAFGLRLGECLGLRWSDLDLTRQTITIRHQLQNVAGDRTLVAPKTAGSAIVRVLPGVTVAALARHRSTQLAVRLQDPDWRDHDLVLPARHGQPWAHQSFRNSWGYWLRQVGFAPAVNPHDLRRTCITLLLAAGVPPSEVQQHVGHASLDLTMGTYKQVLGSSAAATARVVDELFGVGNPANERAENGR